MANKQLTAKVRLNTKDAEKSLDRLVKKINGVQNAVNKTATGNDRVTTAINKSVTKTKELEDKTKRVNTANNKAVSSANKLSNAYRSSNTAAGALLKTVKSLAATYLGIMGARAVINASDTITSAENRLNNIEGGNPTLTQESMDKMYAAAQRSRSGYGAMLDNVGKTMTLAGDSFQNNIDNAIRFQEIMSKAYTVGGASAAEQASSMYQLVQALGSGILQGDELRSVREGAPIAYKEIEKFAQGVFNTEESLKDLASRGIITSDIIVAAIMNAEDEITKSFNNTQMTFGQAWESVKNMALQAFKPVLQMISDALNSKVGRAIVTGIGGAFVILANILLWLGDVFGTFFNWCSENWYWLQWVVYGVVSAIIVYFTIMAAQAVWAGLKAFWAFLTGLSPLYIWIMVIGLIIAALVYLANTTSSVCEFIYTVCMMVALGILGFLAVVIAASLATGTILMSIPMLIGLFIIALLAVLIAAFVKYTGEIIGYAYGIAYSIEAICTNIGIAWQNMCAGLSQWFYNSIADMLDSCSWLLDGINKIREALGKSPIEIDTIRAKADEAGAGKRSYVDVGNAWDTGYSKGYSIGENIQGEINSWGDKIKNLASGFNLTDKFTNPEGSLNFGSYLPGAYDPALALDGAYDPNAINDDILKGLEKIGDDTGSIKDSMDLRDDDLDFLRKIADMEWRKEFTTAEIKIDMTNNNNVNGNQDLDGIVEYLSEVLREEMTAVAYGDHL